MRLYEKLGAHSACVDGVDGVQFAVWAPNAESVSLIGDFNAWDKTACPLAPREDGSGIWEGFESGLTAGQRYKYRIRSRYHGYAADKGDPFAFRWESPPATSSLIWPLDYEWHDAEWMDAAAACELARRAVVNLRSASRFLAARARGG